MDTMCVCWLPLAGVRSTHVHFECTRLDSPILEHLHDAPVNSLNSRYASPCHILVTTLALHDNQN